MLYIRAGRLDRDYDNDSEEAKVETERILSEFYDKVKEKGEQNYEK